MEKQQREHRRTASGYNHRMATTIMVLLVMGLAVMIRGKWIRPKAPIKYIAAVMLLAYVACYLVVSRRGHREQDMYKSNVYYFSSPYNSGNNAIHTPAKILFFPLSSIDRMLNERRIPGDWPLILDRES